MKDQLGTLWQADAHTFAKHRILTGYLQAWMPILSQVSRCEQGILFVDAFAGPGQYEGGEPGSPIAALQVAAQHQRSFPCPVKFLFIEKDPDRFAHLEQVLNKHKDLASYHPNIELLRPRLGDCDPILRKLLARTNGKIHGPALFFLDQFGYGAVSMDFIRFLMSGRSCEVLTYLEVRRLSAYLTDPTKEATITAAFGNEDWKEAIPLSGIPRLLKLAKVYRSALLSQAGEDAYVWHFGMRGAKNALIYWLFFCTQHRRGLEEMKRAMRRVDDSGEFVFSDVVNQDQLNIFGALGDDWLKKKRKLPACSRIAKFH